MSEKCLWCGKSTSQLTEIRLRFRGKSGEAKICSSTCETNLRDFARYAETHTKDYIVGLVLSILLGLLITFWRIRIDSGALGVFIIFAGCGAVLIRYPFVTPQTVNLLGAKKAIASGRILGAINIILGVVFWIVLSQLRP